MTALAVSAAFAAASFTAQANPSGASISHGGATFTVNGKTLTITNTPGAIINWAQFSIAQDEITRFIQQHAASAVLNRVVSQNPSLILGQLLSNGRVFLINPSGITFGRGAVIDVAGFAASTLNITDADWIAGRMRFAGTGGEGSITNAGTIQTASGGQVYLIAPKVENQAESVIKSPNGQVVIAAGKTVELVNSGTPDIRVEFTAPQGEAVNAGEIVAASGQIGIYGNLIKNTGRISASRAEVGDGGKIVLRATGDTIVEGASRIEATGDKGGEIQVLGERVGLMDNALVNASGERGGGTVLVGGDYQGKNPDVPNATATYMSAGASVKANSTSEGDGGRVIVWSNESTRAYGTIEARGGGTAGAGGFIETSGHWLDVRGLSIDASGPGRGGTWLLDPYNVTISSAANIDGSFGGGNPDIWTPDNTTSNVQDTQITSKLNANTSVTITTIGSGSDAGDITVDSSAVLTGITGTATLRLQADGDIALASGISGTDLTLELIANNDNNAVGGAIAGSGAVSVAALTANTQNTGASIGLTGSVTVTGNATLSAGTSGSIVFSNSFSAGSLSATGNSITDVATASLSVTGNASFTAPTITLGDTATDSVNLGSLTYSSAGTVSIAQDSAMVLAGASSAANATLVSSASISQAGGSSVSGVLSTISSTGTVLTGANTLTSFSAINDTTGAIQLANTTGTLEVAGINQGAGAGVTISNTGDIEVTGAVTAAGGVSLTASGSIAETGSGAITAASLTTSSATGQNLAGANEVDSFSATNSTSGAITLQNNTVSLAITSIDQAATDAVDVTTTGAISVDGVVTSGGSVSLAVTGVDNDLTISGAVSPVITADGDITLSAANRIIFLQGAGVTGVSGTGGASVVTLNAGTDAGSAHRTIVGNAAGATDVSAATLNLNSVNGTGTAPIETAVTNLAVSNTIGGTVEVSDAGSLNLNSSSVTGSLSLTSSGAITQAASSTVTVSGTTTLNAGPANNITLTETTNDFGTVAVAAGNDVSLTDTNSIGLGASTPTGRLTVTAVDTLSITGAIVTAGGVDLSGDQVTSTAAGTITTTGGIGVTSGLVRISGNAGVSLDGVIRSKGADAGAAAAGHGGNVQITSALGAVTVKAINASGGNADAGGTAGQGGTITIDADGATTLGGAVQAHGGTLDGVEFSAVGGAILVNAGGTSSGVTDVNTAVLTNVGLVDIRGTSITVGPNAPIHSRFGIVNLESGAGGSVSIGTGSTMQAGMGGITIIGPGGVSIASELSTLGGPVTINAGTGTYTQTNVDVTADTGAITVTADTLSLAANTGNNAFQTTGTLNLRPFTANRAMSLEGSAGFNVSTATLAGTGTPTDIVIGQDNVSTGTMTIGGAVSFAGKNLTLHAGSVTDSGTNTITANSLTMETTGAIGALGNAIDTAVTTLSALSGGGGVYLSDADGVSVAGTSGGGAFSVTAGGAGNTLTVGAGNINAGAGAVTLRGDALVLTGTVTGNGGVTLRPNTSTEVIGVEDSTPTFNVTDLMLSQITTTGTVTIGAVDHTGDISAAGVAAVDDGNKIALVTGGSINLVGATGNGIKAAALTLTADADGNNTGAITQVSTGRLETTAGDLTLSAAQGIGAIAGPAPVRIGSVVGGDLTASNTFSGDLFLDIVAASLNVGGTGISQFSGGALRLDSSGNMVINGDLDAGTGSISLNPTGALTRAGGTLVADTIRLGVDANAVTSIGAIGAAVVVDGGTINPSVSATATAGGIYLNQESGDLLTSNYALSVAGAAGQAIELATTEGHIAIDHNYTTHWNANTQDDNVSLRAVGTDKNINRGSGAILITTGNVTLNASGGIGTTTPVVLDSAGDLSLTTAGASATGDIQVVQTVAGGFNTGTVTALATDTGSVQAISLTYSPTAAADFTIGGSIGNSQDNLALSNTNGNIVGGAGLATANILALSSTTGGIGVGTAVSTNAAILRASAATTIDAAEATDVQLGDGTGSVTAASGSITITTTNGAITTGAAVTTTGGNGSISLLSGGTGGIVLGHDVSTDGSGDVRLMTGGAITQGAGVITTDALGVRAQTGVDLAQANNAATLAITNGTSGSVTYRDTNAFTIDTVATLGAFNLVDGISNPGRNVTLVAGSGEVTQIGGMNVVAGGLELQGTASYTLTNTTNNVATIAGSTSGTVKYIDADALAVDLVTTSGFSAAANVSLNAQTMDLAVNRPITATGGLVTLQALGGNVTQAPAGTITAGTLGVNAGGLINLGAATNAVSTSVAMRANGGTLVFQNANSYQINMVPADATPVFTLPVDGLNAGANNMTLITNAGEVTQASGKNVFAGGLELQGSGSYTLTEVTNNVATIAGSTSGTVKYIDADALAVDLVTTAGFSGAANVSLNTQTSDLAVNQPITATSGTVRLQSALGNVTQTAAGGITATDLGVNAGAGVDLSAALNAVSGDVALRANGGDLSFRNANSYQINTVAADSQVFSLDVDGVSAGSNIVTLVTDAGTVTQASGKNVTASGLNLQGAGATYTLTNVDNAILTLAGNTGVVSFADNTGFAIGVVNSTLGLSTSGNTTLSTTASVTQSQRLAADGLELLGTGGTYTLTNTSNNVVTIAASGPASVTYTDSNALAVGTVNTIGMTVAGNIQLTTLGGGALDVDNLITTSATGTVTLTNAGALGLNADISADGAVSQNGGGAVTVGGTGTRSITTTNDAVSFATAVALNSPLSVNTDTGAGDITFSSTIAGGQGLTLAAGTGNIIFTGAVGSPTRLGAILINSATNVTANAITAASFTQAAGNGLTDLDGAVDTNGGAGVALTTDQINVDGGISAIGGGVTFTNAGVLNINTNISAAGGVTQNGAGSVTIGGGGTRSISTTNGDVSFATAVTQNAALSIDTNTGAGDITFSSTIAGGQDLTLAAGTGDISVTGTVGVANLAVNSSTASTFNAAVTASGGVTLAAGGGNVAFLNGLSTGAASSFLNTGSLQIGDNAADTSSINTALTHTAGATTLGGSITTGAVQLAATTLAADTTINATGTVDFDSTVIGGGGLTVTTSANTTFTGPVGGTPLAFLTVNGGGTTFIDGGSVATTAAQTYSDNVEIGSGGTTTFTSGSGGISFAGTLTGDGHAISVGAGTGGFSVTGALTNVSDLSVTSAANVAATNASNSISGTASFTASGTVNYSEVDAITLGTSAITGAATVVSADGGIAVSGPITGAGSLTLVAHDTTGGGNTGTIAVNAAINKGAAVTLHAADDISIDATIGSGGGNIELIAGNAAGLDYAAITLPALEAGTGDNFGQLTINQTVNSGGGQIMIVTAGDVTASASQNDVTQRPGGNGNVISNSTLTVVTLKGPGGLGNPGANIYLDSANTPGNTNPNVRLLTCASTGCPAPLPTAPQAPVMLLVAGAQYSGGQIRYNDTSGVNLQGLGTVADFYTFTAGNFTLTANPFSAGSVTIEAAGDIDIDLGQNLFKISDDPASALNFIAGGSINYRNPSYSSSGRGFTIGTPGQPFNNHLNLTAVNSILLENSFYQAGQNLNLAAGATITTPFQGIVPGLATGDVELSGNFTVRTGGNVTASGRNFSLLGGDTGGVGQSPFGQELTAGGNINLLNTGVIEVIAGTATAASAAGARITGNNVTIGTQGGADNPDRLTIKGGTNAVGYATSNTADTNIGLQQADAVVKAQGDLKIYLDRDVATTATPIPELDSPIALELIGGDASATSPACAVVGTCTTLYVTALAALQGNNIEIETNGSVVMQGGTAQMDRSQAVASASAVVLGSNNKRITVRDPDGAGVNGSSHVILTGGTTAVQNTVDAVSAQNTTASARLDPSTLTMNIQGNLVLKAGAADPAPFGSLASARIDAAKEIDITVSPAHFVPFSHGASSGLQGVVLIGSDAASTGLFDKNFIPQPGSANPIFIHNATPIFVFDAALSPAVIQTGLSTFDDSLLAYIIFAANEETRVLGLRRSGTDEDLDAPACQ